MCFRPEAYLASLSQQEVSIRLPRYMLILNSGLSWMRCKADKAHVASQSVYHSVIYRLV